MTDGDILNTYIILYNHKTHTEIAKVLKFIDTEIYTWKLIQDRHTLYEKKHTSAEEHWNHKIQK